MAEDWNDPNWLKQEWRRRQYLLNSRAAGRPVQRLQLAAEQALIEKRLDDLSGEEK